MQIEFKCPTLQALYDTGSVIDADGNQHAIGSQISILHANALYNTVRQIHGGACVEIGMAHGASTLAILCALRDTEASTGRVGKLISIDPYQKDYHDVGLTNVEREGLSRFHQFERQPDYAVLPDLLKQKMQIDFAYIDGSHTFDDTMIDFYYLDKLLVRGGVVGFNDCAVPNVDMVIRYIKKHRGYDEINVGLKRAYLTRDLKRALLNIVFMRSKADRYFRKVNDTKPAWNSYFFRF